MTDKIMRSIDRIEKMIGLYNNGNYRYHRYHWAKL